MPSDAWSSRIADAVFGYDFFISYSQRDGTSQPLGLKNVLESRGFRVFLDQTDYVAGIDLRKETRRQVRKSRKLVILARPGALASEWVLREVEVALEAGRLPVVVNVNSAVEEATVGSELARMIRSSHWLRIDEHCESIDGVVGARVIDELVRGFTYTRQEKKRQRIVSGVALVMAAVAATASWQAVVASRQRAIAQNNFEIARKSADAIVTDIARGLRDVEGMRAGSVEKILGRAQDALDSLARQVGDDPRMLTSKVSMYNEFVETYLATGNTAKASEAAASSVSAARLLVNGSPKATRADLRILGLALLKLGDSQAEVGKLNEAETAYEESRKVRNGLVQGDPTDLVAKRELGVALIRLTDLAMQRAAWSQAKSILDIELRLRQELAEQNPAWRRDLGITYILLTDVELELHHPDEAHLHADRARTIFAQLLAVDGASTKAARDLAIAEQRSGNVALARRQFGAARSMYGTSRERFRALSGTDPGNTEWARDVLVADGKLVDVAIHEGQTAQAQARLSALIDARKALLARSPDNKVLKSDLKESTDLLRSLSSSQTGR